MMQVVLAAHPTRKIWRGGSTESGSKYKGENGEEPRRIYPRLRASPRRGARLASEARTHPVPPDFKLQIGYYTGLPCGLHDDYRQREEADTEMLSWTDSVWPLSVQNDSETLP